MATVSQVLKLVMNINYGGPGWSEGYYLDRASFADGLAIGGQLAAWRANSLAVGGVMNWARLSFIDRPRNTVGVINRPIKPRIYTGGTQYAGPIQQVQTSLFYRTETDDGRWANRLFRGIPDDFVREMTTTAPTLMGTLPAVLPDINDTAVAQFDIFMGFLKLLMENTFYIRKGLGPTANWEMLPWNRLIFRGVADRQTGKAFGTPRGRARKRVPAGGN